jgi:hypothetical protein
MDFFGANERNTTVFRGFIDFVRGNFPVAIVFVFLTGGE